MAIAIAHLTNVYAGSGSYSLTVPATTIGQLLVAGFETGSGGTPGTPTGGGSWALAVSQVGAGGFNSYIYWCICNASVTSVGFSSSGNVVENIDLFQLTGAATSPLDMTGTSTATSSTMTAPTMTNPSTSATLPRASGEFWYYRVAASADQINAGAPSNGFTSTETGNPEYESAAYLISTDAAVHTTTWPLGASTQWEMIGASFTPANAGIICFF